LNLLYFTKNNSLIVLLVIPFV